jgi:hypothetical protein
MILAVAPMDSLGTRMDTVLAAAPYLSSIVKPAAVPATTPRPTAQILLAPPVRQGLLDQTGRVDVYAQRPMPGKAARVFRVRKLSIMYCWPATSASSVVQLEHTLWLRWSTQPTIPAPALQTSNGTLQVFAIVVLLLP